MSEFKFVIKRPLHNFADAGKTQRIEAHAEYPHFVYPIAIDAKSILSTHEQISYAVNDLKMRLIKEIVNAELKFDEESV